MNTIKVLIANSEKEVRDGVADTLSKDENLKIVATAADSKELFALCNEHLPNVLIAHPKLLIAEDIAHLRKKHESLEHGEYYSLNIIAFAEDYSSADIKRLLEMDVVGYLLYDVTEEQTNMLASHVKAVDNLYCIVEPSVLHHMASMIAEKHDGKT